MKNFTARLEMGKASTDLEGVIERKKREAKRQEETVMGIDRETLDIIRTRSFDSLDIEVEQKLAAARRAREPEQIINVADILRGC